MSQANQNIKKGIEQSDSDDEPENLQYKIVILGNGTVGKTSIINRFCEDFFAKSYKQTIGVDFYVKRLEMPGNINVIFVYDITNQQSFQDLEDWLALVKKTFEGKEMPLLILMGNKIDLVHMQAVKPEQHDKFAESKNLYSFTVSAKSGDMINSCFYKIAADLAGIPVSSPTQEIIQKPLVAEIVQHVGYESSQPKAEDKLKQMQPEKKEKKCTIF